MSPTLADAGYAGTPLPQKLGYKDGQRVLFIGLPARLESLLAARAFSEVARAAWGELAARGGNYDVVHGFAASRAELAEAAGSLRRAVKPDGMVWISWPKRASGVPSDISDGTIREVLLPTGLVDVKVATVDEVWSGLKLVIRRQLR